MTYQLILMAIAVAALFQSLEAYIVNIPNSAVSRINQESKSALFAHHPEFKIIRRKMHRRPKKHRLSDINRNNVNLGKCITKIPDAPAEYILMSAEDYAANREKALQFWETGDPSAEWIEITPEDMESTFSQNRDPLPVGGVQKRPPIKRSGLTSTTNF